ncbi:MAG: aminoacyl-tRNA hydrolase [Candidatus Levybacteria bacterium]|nr:aminoacyl-tRNA hydrolase [Candidatus Levybacteria bacterium]
MKLIVGLGNPGEKHESTRHNLGFIIIDHLLKDIESVRDGKWEENVKFKGEIFSLEYKPKKGEIEKVILLKPKTYMNNSGMAVSLVASFYKVNPQDIWIIHDELDLPLGFMKIRLGGGAAGHHGVESVMTALNTDKFWRFRIGIGASKNRDEIAKHNFKNAKDFVLDIFRTGESGTVKHIIKRAVEALKLSLEKDINSAMNRFNTK